MVSDLLSTLQVILILFFRPKLIQYCNLKLVILLDFTYSIQNDWNLIIQGSDGGVREAILTALKGVMKHAGKNVSSAVRDRAYSVLKDLIHHDDERVRMYAARILGILTQVCKLLRETSFTG